jgi:hypothetical protein
LSGEERGDSRIPGIQEVEEEGAAIFLDFLNS